MSHVNTTPHYGLPIYGENDIINPLTDFNDGNSAIDTALYEIADAQGSEASAISDINVFLGDKELETVAQNVTDAINEVNTAVGNADTAIGNVAGDVVTLQTAVGNASTGLIHDVSELQTTVGSQGNSITALQGTVGDADSGLVKNVADLATAVGDANSGLVKDVNDLQSAVGKREYTLLASVTTDGVKTVAQLLGEMWTAISGHIDEIPLDAKLMLDNDIYSVTEITNTVVIASIHYVGGLSLTPYAYIASIAVSATPTFAKAEINSNGTAITNQSSLVLASGRQFKLYV